MIYLFDNKENLIHIVPRSELRDAIQTIELNKSLSLDLEFKNINFDLINGCEYVGHFYEDVFYMYRIIRNDMSDTNTIKGTHIVFDELKSNGYIRDKRPNKTSAALALGAILDGTRWQVGTVQSNNIGTSNWYDISKLDALSDLISKWNVELDYRIIFDGQKITARYIDVYNRLGSYTGKRFVYGTNMLDITAETSKANIYTALIGRGKGEEKIDESGEVTGGYGRRIQFTDVVWSKSKGDPVDKPSGQEYVEIPERTAQFGFSNGQPRTKVIIFEDCTDPNELLKLTYAELEKISRPQVTFKTTIHKSSNFYVGDTVNIIRRDLNLFYEARVFKIERNLLNNDLSVVELGDYIPTNAEKHSKDIKNRLDSANNAIDNAKINLDVKVNELKNDIDEKVNQVNANTSGKIDEVKNEIGTKVNELLEDLKNGLELQYYNDAAFNYELSIGNKWKLPAGYYSFDRSIDSNPTKVIYFGAGKIMIANRKKSDGSWQWSTFGTGDGFVADMITSGHINSNLISAGSIVSSHIASSAIKAVNIAGNTITGAEIASNAIDTRHLRADSITGDKIQARSITADEIKVGTITATNIQNSTITNSEIAGHTVTGSEVAYNTLDSNHIRDITVDILRPGSNNRIIFEGSNPGDNDCKSIDATGSAIRFKNDASNYVAVWSDQIEFYSSWGSTRSRGSDFYANSFNQTSDIRLKENIGYLDGATRIKPNNSVEIAKLSSLDIYEFFKNAKLTTYNYLFDNNSRISFIAQDLLKYENVCNYLVRVDEISKDKRKFIDSSNLQNITVAVVQDLIKKVEKLESEISNLKKGGSH